jgi:hypothetical protein
MHGSNCGGANPQGCEFWAPCGARFSLSGSPSAQGCPSPILSQTHPIGIGGIIDETIRLYRQNVKLFILVVAALEVPILVFQMTQTLIVASMMLTSSV